MTYITLYSTTVSFYGNYMVLGQLIPIQHTVNYLGTLSGKNQQGHFPQHTAWGGNYILSCPATMWKFLTYSGSRSQRGKLSRKQT